MCLIKMFFLSSFSLALTFNSGAIDMPDPVRADSLQHISLAQIEQKIVANKDFIPESVLQEFAAILDTYDVKHIEAPTEVKDRLQAEMSRIEQMLSTCRNVVYTFGAFIEMQSFIIALRLHQQAVNGFNLILSLISAGFLYAFIYIFEEKQKLIQSILERIV